MSKKKQKHEVLVPGDKAWELWSGGLAGAFVCTSTFEDGPGAFSRGASRRVLALPAASLWVLPAWMKGTQAHLRDMAQLHLERLGVRTPQHAESLCVDALTELDGSILARVVALKDVPTPLADFRVLPEECRLSASCLPLPANSLIVWRELGRLVVAITIGPRLAYFSPLSSAALDHGGLAELNNICLQLTFQRVLSNLSGIVLWIEDGNVEAIQKATGVPVTREDRPAPQIAAVSKTGLMPGDVIATRQASESASRTRLLVLGGAFVMAALVAAFMVVMSMATQERDALREQVAEITPRAAKVQNHKEAWQEVATAVDPNSYPMELLMRCMEPKASNEVTLTGFECTQDTIMIRGRAPEISPALKYSEELKQTDSLAFTWDPGIPRIESDNSATFELKGTRNP
ncbi:MAG: hypothetical protein JWO89_2144 [Verrucomicrobiaceae bacterium]|nr:hypothetical protein [Verrucomicrobiaceae bacterium]